MPQNTEVFNTAAALERTKGDRHVFINGFVCRVCMSLYLVVVFNG